MSRTPLNPEGKLFMKKRILSTMIAGLSMFAAHAAAAQSTITFSARVLGATCSIHGGAPDSPADLTVTLPSVRTTDFADDGTTTGITPFSIYVGGNGETGCIDGTIVNVHFDPNSPRVNPDTGYLVVDPGAGAATGVEIQILNTRNVPIDLWYKPDSPQYTVANNSAVIPFSARYVSTSKNVTAGSANSSVLYSIAYH
jgi:major type 1 subunit fimbrin (pilin)